MAAVDFFRDSLTRMRAGICARVCPFRSLQVSLVFYFLFLSFFEKYLQVVIKIVQEIVLTRRGFEAKLELDNSGEVALTVCILWLRP